MLDFALPPPLRTAATALVCLASLADSGQLLAQRPAVCGADARMELKCRDACIICDIDGFRGRNNNGGRLDEGDKPNGFCTSVNHNIQWIGFLAGSAELTLEISVSNCVAGDRPDGGLEAGVFEVLDCDLTRAVAKSNCDSDIGNGTTQVFTMTTLVPGNFYYLVIDGNNGDVCDYSVRVTSGTTRVPEVPSSGGLRGPQRVCRGRSFDYQTSRVPGAPYYDWTLDGTPIGTEDDLGQSITFPADGDYQLCVTASNLCNVGPQECLTIRVGDLSPTRVTRSSCDNAPVTVDGRTFTTSGEYPVLLETRLGCDSTVVYDIRIRDRITTALDTVICAGKTLRFDGRDLSAAGTYTQTTRLASGCDSTVTLTLGLRSCGYEVDARVTDVRCAGGEDGTIRVSVVGPGAPYSFRYRRLGDPGFTSFGLAPDGTPVRIENLRAGTYELIWRDVYAAEQIRTVTVGEPAALRLTLTPELLPSGFAISCPGASDGTLQAATSGGTPPYTLAWADGGQGAARTGLTAGSYSLTLLDANGCRQNASVTLSAPPPIPETRIALETCANEPVTLGGQTRTQSGTYPVTLQARSGCDSVVVYALTVSPVSASTVDSLICEGSAVDFHGRTLRTAGTYAHTLQNALGCDSVVTLRLTTRSCAYTFTTRTVDVRCAGERTGVILLTVDGSEPSYDLAWSSRSTGLGGRLVLPGDSSTVRLDGLPADEYQLRVVDAFGVRAERAARITAPPPLLAPLASERRGNFDISCAGRADGRLLATPRGGTPPYAYTWSTGQTTPEATGLRSGPVSLSVTDANGCVTPASYTLLEPEPLGFAATPIPEGCDPEQDPGGVSLEGLSGGQPPYRVLLDDGRPANLAPTFRLSPGTHTVTVEDEQRCRSTQLVTVTAPERPSISVDPIPRLNRGDTLRLAPDYRGDIVTYAWTATPTLSCLTCPSPLAFPEVTTTYDVAVTNADGCTATAQLRVNVGVNPTIYVPTAISPNGDGSNDGFTVFTAEPGAVVEEMQVFDRWGEQVFAKAEFPANEPALGWDGTFRGERVNPGVYAFWARVRIPDGETELVKGDLTVMR